LKEGKRKYISKLSSVATIRLLIEMALITGYVPLMWKKLLQGSLKAIIVYRVRSNSLFLSGLRRGVEDTCSYCDSLD